MFFARRGKRKNFAEGGFTLIEMVAVLGITIMLLGAMSMYRGIGEDQISIFTEGSKVMQTILQAKSYALATWLAQNKVICGYGFHRVEGSDTDFEVARYTMDSADCPDLDALGASKSSFDNIEPVSASSLAKGLHFLNSTNDSADIFFLPPDPKIYFFDNNGQIIRNSTSSVAISNGKTGMIITVGQGGQIDYTIQ